LLSKENREQGGIMKRVLWFICFAVFMVPGLSIISTAAGQEFPTRPITIYVGYPPGGGLDLSARKMADMVGKYLNNQPVVVENRPGGTGVVCTAALANAKPDGHTIMVMDPAPFVLIPFLRKVSYDPLADFKFVLKYSDYQNLFCLKKSTPINSWKEWLEYARKNPDTATYSTPGPGSLHHVYMQDVLGREKIKIRHVPTKGGAEAKMMLLGGHVDAILMAGMLQYMRSGDAKALAVMAKDRLATLPDIPTFSELGYSDVRVPTWLGMIAPAKTPAPVLKKLEEAFTKVVEDPAFQQLMTSIEFINSRLNSKEFQKLVESHHAYYAPLMKSLGIEGL
jgi:tripartite-type tricarboxylate transporter receptor subunit TctC